MDYWPVSSLLKYRMTWFPICELKVLTVDFDLSKLKIVVILDNLHLFSFVTIAINCVEFHVGNVHDSSALVIVNENLRKFLYLSICTIYANIEHVS